MVNVHCYTFGSPRVGNHAWARAYDKAVPDTWHLINNDDVITQAGKVRGGRECDGRQAGVRRAGGRCRRVLLVVGATLQRPPTTPIPGPRCLQFVFLYKRAGHRVLINRLGDLIVRPSYFEVALRQAPGGE